MSERQPKAVASDTKQTTTYRRTTLAVVRQKLPLTGNICDRRLWRIKEASVGVAADFVRRSKPHKQNRDTARGQ